MSRSVTADYLRELLEQSPDRLAVFPLPPETTQEDHERLVRDLANAVAVLQEYRSLHLAYFDGDHDDFPDAERVYVVHAPPREMGS